MSLAEIVHKLSIELEVPLSLSEQGLCTFIVNDLHKITIEQSVGKEEFFIYSPVAEIDAAKRDTIFARSMEGNLFGKETGNSVLAYEPSSRMLVLFQKFPFVVDYTLFSDEFHYFLGILEYWKKIVDKWEKTRDKKIHYLDAAAKAILGQQKIKIFMP